MRYCIAWFGVEIGNESYGIIEDSLLFFGQRPPAPLGIEPF